MLLDAPLPSNIVSNWLTLFDTGCLTDTFYANDAKKAPLHSSYVTKRLMASFKLTDFGKL